PGSSLYGPASGMYVVGGFGYVTWLAESSGMMTIIDLSDAFSPEVISHTALPLSEAGKIAVSNRMVLVANGTGGIEVLDVTDPVHPVRIQTILTNGEALDVLIRENYAYVAAGTAGVEIYDIASPFKARIGSVNTFGIASALQIQGNYLYVAGDALDT